MGRHFLVRENHTKNWKSQGIEISPYLNELYIIGKNIGKVGKFCQSEKVGIMNHATHLFQPGSDPVPVPETVSVHKPLVSQ